MVEEKSPSPTRAVLVHGVEDARLALSVAEELGLSATLISSPSAASHGGAGWFLEMCGSAAAAAPNVSVTAIVDCDDRAGDAQGALAVGAKHILFTGRAEAAARLADIAAASGAAVGTERPPALDLRGRRDPRPLCRAWLVGMSMPDI